MYFQFSFITDYKLRKALLRNKSCIVVTYATESIGAESVSDQRILEKYLERDFINGDLSCINRINCIACWGHRFKDTIDRQYPFLASKTFVIGHPRYLSYNEDVKRPQSIKTIGISVKDNALNDYMGRSPYIVFLY